jgi:hypothetical protein
MLRRLILILCIVAILPTTIDPSCVGYFIYSNAGLSTVLGDVDAAAMEGTVAESDRPIEVLATVRVPSQVSIEPATLLELHVLLFAPLAVPEGGHRRDAAPDFLAPAQRTTFLRNAVLLI